MFNWYDHANHIPINLLSCVGIQVLDKQVKRVQVPDLLKENYVIWADYLQQQRR